MVLARKIDATILSPQAFVWQGILTLQRNAKKGQKAADLVSEKRFIIVPVWSETGPDGA